MNRLILAVAGSRKTQTIVDHCSQGDAHTRRLAITYTQTGQSELEGRLRKACAPGSVPPVMGWYAFLIGHYIRPYLPRLFPGRQVRGLNFDGDPGRYAKGERRFLDQGDRAFRLHLSTLARKVAEASSGGVIDRLSRIYDEIHIDEVQDLTGNDLHILEELLVCSEIDMHLVGDVRQSVFDTNPRDQNLKKYRGIAMLDWFSLQEDSGLLAITTRNTTWRSNQAIATFSDSIFASQFTFQNTVSLQNETTGHDGVFAITEAQVPSYLATCDAQPLRSSKKTTASMELPFRNFGKVKGLTFDRVLIYPTQPITRFLTDGVALQPRSACQLYVAVTRARHSVAFVVPDPSETQLSVWSGSN